jgi:hypothetical protein
MNTDCFFFWGGGGRWASILRWKNQQERRCPALRNPERGALIFTQPTLSPRNFKRRAELEARAVSNPNALSLATNRPRIVTRTRGRKAAYLQAATKWSKKWRNCNCTLETKVVWGSPFWRSGEWTIGREQCLDLDCNMILIAWALCSVWKPDEIAYC